MRHVGRDSLWGGWSDARIFDSKSAEDTHTTTTAHAPVDMKAASQQDKDKVQFRALANRLRKTIAQVRIRVYCCIFSAL